jgi:hypothetical protein
VCTVTVISRSPYRDEKRDCGSCGCLDSAKANQHSYGSAWTNSLGMLRKNCHRCGHEAPA